MLLQDTEDKDGEMVEDKQKSEAHQKRLVSINSKAKSLKETNIWINNEYTKKPKIAKRIGKRLLSLEKQGTIYKKNRYFYTTWVGEVLWFAQRFAKVAGSQTVP